MSTCGYYLCNDFRTRFSLLIIIKTIINLDWLNAQGISRFEVMVWIIALNIILVTDNGLSIK